MTRSRTRRSVVEWSVRAGLATLAAALGYGSVNQTYAYSIQSWNPARAYALAPRDGRLAGAAAQQMTGADARIADFARAGRIAREALMRDPTVVTAVSTLGLGRQVAGDLAGARRLFAYAERLSRRDLRTQLWAIEDSVAREDVPGALLHYDIALRGSRNASGLLFPILAAAIEDSAIRAALVKTMASKPVWAPLFIEYVSSNGPDAKATSLLFQQLRTAGVPISHLSQALLVDALASRGLFEDAWRYYASIHSGIDPRRSRDPSFAANSLNPTLFDWQPLSTEGVSVSVQQLDKHGLLDFSAPASVGGPLAQQTQLLPPGAYRLSGHSIGIDQAESATPYWVLSCRAGRELGRVEVPNSSLNNGNFAGRIDVPAGCPVQNLTLVARPSDAIGGLSGQIDRIEITPLR